MKTKLTLEAAQAELLSGLVPPKSERLSLGLALGRTLAADVTAPMDQPPFDRAPVDGYALRAEDIADASPEHPVSLYVIEKLCAGDVSTMVPGARQAVRIMTGAMIPAGCNCVLRQEDTDMGMPVVRVFASLHPHDNYVNRGEDFQLGDTLLRSGTRLDAAAVGLLASAGIAEVTVWRRPRVRVLSTGDEVISPGIRPLPPGKIYGANLPLLLARLKEMGVSDCSGELVEDDPQKVAEAMARLISDCDLLITTGGVSVGDKDILHQALPLLGAEQVFWRLQLKPGSPAMFSRYKGKPILSLSGNPFAAFTTFELLACPLLAALSGESDLLLRKANAVLDMPFSKFSRIRRFVRGQYKDGHVVLPVGHSSGQLASLLGCNCLVELPAGSPPAEAGQAVQVWLL